VGDDVVIKSEWGKMSTTPKARTEWQRIELRMEFGFLALVLAVVATFLVLISNGTPSVALDTSPVTAAKFSGEVVGIKAISNELVSVRYVVKNISSPSGTPICSIYVADPSGSFPGYSNQSLSVLSIQPIATLERVILIIYLAVIMLFKYRILMVIIIYNRLPYLPVTEELI
jgi:hypothetical protein